MLLLVVVEAVAGDAALTTGEEDDILAISTLVSTIRCSHGLDDRQ
jgi:hypothetical protein